MRALRQPTWIAMLRHAAWLLYCAGGGDLCLPEPQVPGRGELCQHPGPVRSGRHRRGRDDLRAVDRRDRLVRRVGHVPGWGGGRQSGGPLAVAGRCRVAGDGGCRPVVRHRQRVAGYTSAVVAVHCHAGRVVHRPRIGTVDHRDASDQSARIVLAVGRRALAGCAVAHLDPGRRCRGWAIHAGPHALRPAVVRSRR